VRERAWVLGGVIAGLLLALWFSTVVAMGPAPGSIKRSGEAEQGGAQRGATKHADKPHNAEHEAYCRDAKDHKECIIQLRAAEATERQALFALLGLILVLVTIVLTGLGLLLVKGTLDATRAALAEAKTSSGAAVAMAEDRRCARAWPAARKRGY
jgi:hypothetical protein